MVPEQLEPRLELLREEYVLVQAWKKTASYIRYHNWFSDTLALDRAAVNLPAFIGELRERLQSSESWQNDPLRIVPAPKSPGRRVGARHKKGDLDTALTARAYFGRCGSPISAEVDHLFRSKWITDFGGSGSLSAELDHPVSGIVSAHR